MLAVQDEGCFDVVDVTSMQTTSHTPGPGNIVKSYKTRLTQRSGSLAIADTNGFFMADIVSDQAGHYTVKLTSEQYCKDNAVNDFIEYKRDHFLVCMIEVNLFAIVQRAQGGYFDNGKIRKVRSLNMGYLTMGLQLIQGPRIDSSFVLVRDRRGIQLVNLEKGTSHQLMLSPV